MTRKQCEKQILGKLREIAVIAKEYNPDTNYLNLNTFLEDGYAHINNIYYGIDKHKPLNLTVTNFMEERRG